MRETLEREIKLAPGDGFVLPELGGERLPTRRLHLDLPRHARPAARAPRRHVPSSRRGRSGALAAEAAARRGAARARAARAAGAAAGRAGRAAPGVPPRQRSSSPSPASARGGRASGPRAPRSSTTTSPCSRASASPAASGRSRSSCSTATSGPCAGSRRSCARPAPRRRASCSPSSTARSTWPDAVERPDQRRRALPPGEALGIALEARIPGAARARPGDPPGRRSGGPAPAPRRDAAAAGVPPRRATGSSTATGRASLRDGARLARWASRPRPRPRRDAGPSPSRGGRARRRTRDAASGLLDALEDERAAAYRDVVETLGGDRYFALARPARGRGAPPLTGDETTLTKIFHREAKRMRRTFEALGDEPEDDALHASRIAVKRARYAPISPPMSSAGRASGSSRSRSSCRTSSAIIRTPSSPRRASGTGRRRRRPRASSFAAGRLVQLERDRMAAARAAWPETWRRLDKAARRAVR